MFFHFAPLFVPRYFYPGSDASLGGLSARMQLKLHYQKDKQQINATVEVPDECPTCGRLVVFPFQNSAFNHLTKELETIHHCPNRDCGAFIVCYHTGQQASWKLRKVEPPSLSDARLPSFVSEISSSFVSIFREAVEAKDRGLIQIAGPGYRKAFEFLIKDYAKGRAPSDSEVIEKMAAAGVVKNYISDVRVQAVAKRALWIGNDETHYLRKWEDRDINDLAVLIKLTIEWIDIERQSAAYVDDMPES